MKARGSDARLLSLGVEGVTGTVQTGAVMGLELGVLRGLREQKRERQLRKASRWLEAERRQQLAAAAVVKVSAAVVKASAALVMASAAVAVTAQPVAFNLV